MNERIKNIKPLQRALADEGLEVAKGHCVTTVPSKLDLALNISLQPCPAGACRLFLHILLLKQLFYISVAV